MNNEEWLKKAGFDPDRIYVYRLPDLERELADMHDVGTIVFWFKQYLRPAFTEESIKATTEAALKGWPSAPAL